MTTGAIRRAKLQSYCHHQQTNCISTAVDTLIDRQNNEQQLSVSVSLAHFQVRLGPPPNLSQEEPLGRAEAGFLQARCP